MSNKPRALQGAAMNSTREVALQLALDAIRVTEDVLPLKEAKDLTPGQYIVQESRIIEAYLDEVEVASEGQTVDKPARGDGIPEEIVEVYHSMPLATVENAYNAYVANSRERNKDYLTRENFKICWYALVGAAIK